MNMISLNFVMLKKHILLLIFMLSQVNSEEDHLYSVQYTKDNFSTEIQKKNHLVMFYAPWYVFFYFFKRYIFIYIFKFIILINFLFC